MQYSTPSFPFQEQPGMAGPMPIEKRCTTSPRRRAARKWPSSWTKIDPPKKNTIRKTDQEWESSECRKTGDIEFQQRSWVI